MRNISAAVDESSASIQDIADGSNDSTKLSKELEKYVHSFKH
ncbi:hypothetical protein MTP04_19140 [Lysinibacillus sp. PLM2]|nr:hypothetical protein MTP04_19140 [Lysinibacillus sp. PLM2]